VADAVLAHAAPPVLAVRPGEPAPRFRTILCPVDQSDVSRRGLENAIGLARTFGGEVIVLTVVPEVSWLSAAVETGRLAGARAAHEARWREEFDQFLAGVPFDGVPGSREVRHGVPHEQIVACAHEHQADVIVLGATGRTGLARVLLGSVTRRLLRRLPCSLLVVKDRDAVAAPSPEEQQVVQVLAAQGRELLAAGSLEAARERLERAVAHDPFHTAAVAGLAEALERLGRREEAAYYRRRAEALKG
jgi:nucleotide-binding universal stress UspA family protein